MAGKLVGRGQYTIVKLHDGKHMQLHLACNLSTIQHFSRLSHTFSPNYTVTPLVITPEVYFSGSQTNQNKTITNPVWQINGDSPIRYGGIVSGNAPYSLTIHKNMAVYHQLHITFSCTVIDPDTLMENNMTSQICITKQEIESITPTMIMELPSGNLFKNEIYDSLSAVCKLMIGTEQMLHGVEYVWYHLHNNQYVKVQDNFYIQGQNTNTLTVLSDFVNKQSDFKCEVKYGNTLYTEFVTFAKQIDPYTLTVENKNGDKMRNGEGVIYCEAHIHRSGEMLPDDLAESMFMFQWIKCSRLTGEQDKTWRNPTTRAIELTKSDIDTLSTFICEVKLKNNALTYRLPLNLT